MVSRGLACRNCWDSQCPGGDRAEAALGGWSWAGGLRATPRDRVSSSDAGGCQPVAPRTEELSWEVRVGELFFSEKRQAFLSVPVLGHQSAFLKRLHATSLASEMQG